MDRKKELTDKFEQQVTRAIPSQAIMVVTRASYDYALKHAMTQVAGNQAVWACRKSGAKMHARCVKMNIFDRATGELERLGVPVCVFFCSACDKVPPIHKDDPIYLDLLRSVSM